METGKRERLFHEAIGEMQGFIRRIAAAHERDEDLRKDLAQDIAMAVWQALPNFRGEASIKTFVGRVAVNRCLSHAAKHARIPSSDGLADHLSADEPGPEMNTHEKLSAERLHLAVAQLPVSLRQPAVLMLEGYKTGEIAEILGVSAGAVSVRLNRAKSNLSEMLEDPNAN